MIQPVTPPRLAEYFCFEVRLLEVEPNIWRKFLLKASATFEDLHHAIQDACGWEESHLFSFSEEEDGPVIAGAPEPEDEDPDASEVKIRKYFAKRDRCLYVYDFGDNCVHAVRLLERVKLDERFTRRLLDGARAFPKEDSGGFSGYQRFVTILTRGKDPYGEDPESMREWLDGWDPEKFDLAAVKKAFDEYSTSDFLRLRLHRPPHPLLPDPRVHHRARQAPMPERLLHDEDVLGPRVDGAGE